jgi:hypothetical protein
LGEKQVFKVGNDSITISGFFNIRRNERLEKEKHVRKDVALGIVYWFVCICIMGIVVYSLPSPYFTLENEILAGLVLFPLCIVGSVIYEAFRGEPSHYRPYREPRYHPRESSSFHEDEDDAYERGYAEERGRQDALDDYYEGRRQEREYRRRQKEAQDYVEDMFIGPPRNNGSSPEDIFLGEPKKKKKRKESDYYF